MGRERIQTRADGDTVEQIDEYRDDHDVSDSEAMRRLIRRGLEAEGYRGDGDDATDEYAKASVNETVRIIAGVMIGVTTVIVLLAELGVI